MTKEKEIPKRIDATRKHVRDSLDALRDRVRQPLTDYENAEKSRIAALDQRIAAIQVLGVKATTESPSAEIQLWIGELEAIAIDATWDEYQDRAAVAKEAAKVKLEAFSANSPDLGGARRDFSTKSRSGRKIPHSA